jgi:SpoVK/Ycf46/Vps4 family AAA+-type ATPase
MKPAEWSRQSKFFAFQSTLTNRIRFMTHWDGLVSSNSQGQPQRICILGATNRIQDIDEAILRRMPKKFPVPLPNAAQRRGIFSLVLKDTRIDTRHFDLDHLVALSAGLSGSDIKEECRDAAMVPMRELIRARNKSGSLRKPVDTGELRGLRTEDFFRRARDSLKDVLQGAHPRSQAVSTVVEELTDEKAWTDASSDPAEDELTDHDPRDHRDRRDHGNDHRRHGRP